MRCRTDKRDFGFIPCGDCVQVPKKAPGERGWIHSRGLGGHEPMSWTDERVELLKKLWSDGLSASQIAAKLGGITRNAVIGKVLRLGLSDRAKSPSSAAPQPHKTHTTSHKQRKA